MCPAFLLAANNRTGLAVTGTTPFVVQLQGNFPYHTIPIVLLSNCYRQMNVLRVTAAYCKKILFIKRDHYGTRLLD